MTSSTGYRRAREWAPSTGSRRTRARGIPVTRCSTRRAPATRRRRISRSTMRCAPRTLAVCEPGAGAVIGFVRSPHISDAVFSPPGAQLMSKRLGLACPCSPPPPSGVAATRMAARPTCPARADTPGAAGAGDAGSGGSDGASSGGSGGATTGTGGASRQRRRQRKRRHDDRRRRREHRRGRRGRRRRQHVAELLLRRGHHRSGAGARGRDQQPADADEGARFQLRPPAHVRRSEGRRRLRQDQRLRRHRAHRRVRQDDQGRGDGLAHRLSHERQLGRPRQAMRPGGLAER